MIHRLYLIAVVTLGTLAIHAYGFLPLPSPPLRDEVDLVEVNHFYDQNGKHVFDQAIFWDWDGKRFQVVAWRMLRSPEQLPQRDKGGYYVLWNDDAQGMSGLRHVKAKSIRESWTQFDPELAEREILPVEFRRQLSRR